MPDESLGGNAKEELKSIVERIERLLEERTAIDDDIKAVKQEARGSGFSVSAIQAIIQERKQDAEEVKIFEAVKDTYRHALGMLADLPLGRASIEAEARRTRREKETKRRKRGDGAPSSEGDAADK
jgi:uncharacterized protein (UPF0335 family)